MGGVRSHHQFPQIREFIIPQNGMQELPDKQRIVNRTHYLIRGIYERESSRLTLFYRDKPWQLEHIHTQYLAGRISQYEIIRMKNAINLFPFFDKI